MMRRLIATLAAVLALGLVAPTAAQAQSDADRCKEEQEGQSSGKNYRTEIRDGRKIFVIERAFVVCGKVPKPQVIYVLQQRNINYEWDALKQDFLPRILSSVKKAPF